MAEPYLFLSLSAAFLAVFFILYKAGSDALRQQLGQGMAALSVTLAVVGLACVIASTIVGQEVAFITRPVRGWLAWGVPLVAGAAWAAALLGADGAGRAPYQRAIAWGTAWYVGLAFIGFEIGKVAHDAEMREFFRASGLPLALMYAVLVVETVAALGLLLGYRRRACAGVLAAMMVAAIGTHVHNGDPLTDSLDAIRMLVLAAALLLLESRRTSSYLMPSSVHMV